MVGGGLGTPLAPESFTEPYKMGYTLKGAAGYFVSPQLNIGLNLSYNQFGLDQDEFNNLVGGGSDFIGIEGGNLFIFEIAGTARYYFTSSNPQMNFYIIGGAGVGITRISEIKIKTYFDDFAAEPESESDLLLTGGLGITYRIHPSYSIFVEARYSNIFAEENISYLPVRAGISF